MKLEIDVKLGSEGTNSKAISIHSRARFLENPMTAEDLSRARSYLSRASNLPRIVDRGKDSQTC